MQKHEMLQKIYCCKSITNSRSVSRGLGYLFLKQRNDPCRWNAILEIAGKNPGSIEALTGVKLLVVRCYY